MTYFSRNSCLYHTPSSGVDFLLVSFLAVSSQSKSSLTQSLHKHCEGMKTTIDWDCSSQCLDGGAGLHCKPYIFSMTISIILIGFSDSNTACYSPSQMPCYILICPIAESHISWNSMVTLSFLGDLFASRRWSRERGYLPHSVYFLDHRCPKLTRYECGMYLCC